MRMLRLIVLLMLIPPSAYADDYATLFEDAVRKVTWKYPADWAYTETRQGTEGVEVGRGRGVKGVLDEVVGVTAHGFRALSALQVLPEQNEFGVDRGGLVGGEDRRVVTGAL